MDRTRSTALPQITAQYALLKKSCYQDGSVVHKTIDTVNESAITEYTTMNDVVVQDFHARKLKGEIFINPMSQRKEQAKSFPVRWSFTNHSAVNGDPVSISYTGDYHSPEYFSFLDVAQADLDHCADLTELALTSAFAGQTTSKAAAIVLIAEGKETVTGTYDVFMRLFRILKAVKKHQFKALKRELSPSEMADFWMEIRYGIRPIIFDCKQIMDAYKDTTKVGDRRTSRGSQSYYKATSDTVTYPSGTHDFDVTRECSFAFLASAGVLSQVDRINMLDVFGFNDPLMSIYDLTTLSFVLDWFFNVGDTLAAATPEMNLTTLGAWTKETFISKQTAYVNGISNCQKSPLWNCEGSASSEPWVTNIETTVRTPRTRASYLPRFNLNLNWAKVIDLGIILRNVYQTIKSNDVRITRLGRRI